MGPRLARALGWFVYEQPLSHEHAAVWANCIISRYRMTAPEAHGLRVRVELPGGFSAWMSNCHFTDFPYGPFQLSGIPYSIQEDLDNAERAIEVATEARGDGVQQVIKSVATLAEKADVVFIFGDFNEPSHRDWTEEAAATGLCPIAVRWPTVKALEEVGFYDAFREALPDPAVHHGRGDRARLPQRPPYRDGAVPAEPAAAEARGGARP